MELRKAMKLGGLIERAHNAGTPLGALRRAATEGRDYPLGGGMPYSHITAVTPEGNRPTSQPSSPKLLPLRLRRVEGEPSPYGVAGAGYPLTIPAATATALTTTAAGKHAAHLIRPSMTRR